LQKRCDFWKIPLLAVFGQVEVADLFATAIVSAFVQVQTNKLVAPIAQLDRASDYGSKNALFAIFSNGTQSASSFTASTTYD
jgi:hypothetical protein